MPKKGSRAKDSAEKVGILSQHGGGEVSTNYVNSDDFGQPGTHKPGEHSNDTD